MGIDLGFTDESLSHSKHAHCAKLRRQVAAVYSPVEPGEADELAEYRRYDERVDLARLKEQNPTLYDRTVDAGRLLPFETKLRWTEQTRIRLNDPEIVSQLERYAERQANPWVRVEELPKDMRKRLVARSKKDNRLSAWYAMPYEEGIANYCKGCPIRPPDETNCYLRFSSYPGMDTFREGFLMTLLYAGTIDKEKLGNAWFSFQHLDRDKGQLPKDKIAELFNEIGGVEVNKKPEEFFNTVAVLLQKIAPGDSTVETEQLSLNDAPLVDEFISALLYRDRPYKPEEAGHFLPYIRTVREVADWAIWDTNNADLRHSLLSFRDRMQTMATAMEYSDKYGLEMYVSY